jgi:hypothetical protein
VTRKKDVFKIGRAARGGPPAPVDIDRLVEGIEPETTKTFRIPVRLSRALKIHAAQTGQTEKEILTRLLAEYLDNPG